MTKAQEDLATVANKFRGILGVAVKKIKKKKEHNSSSAKCAEKGMDYDQTTGKCK